MRAVSDVRHVMADPWVFHVRRIPIARTAPMTPPKRKMIAFLLIWFVFCFDSTWPINGLDKSLQSFKQITNYLHFFNDSPISLFPFTNFFRASSWLWRAKLSLIGPSASDRGSPSRSAHKQSSRRLSRLHSAARTSLR